MCGNGTRWSISKTIWTRPDNDKSSMLTSTSAPTLNNKRIYIIWLIVRDLLIKATTDVPFTMGVGQNLWLKLWIELNEEIQIGYRSSPFLLTEENCKRFLNFRDNLDVKTHFGSLNKGEFDTVNQIKPNQVSPLLQQASSLAKESFQILSLSFPVSLGLAINLVLRLHLTTSITNDWPRSDQTAVKFAIISPYSLDSNSPHLK